jgi:hypothetical protein
MNVVIAAATSVVTVSISPAAATVSAGGTTNFTSTVHGTTQTGVTWEVNGITGGSSSLGMVVAASGNAGQAIYNAPLSVPVPNPVTITARSTADLTASASALLTVTAVAGPPVSVSVTPTTATLSVGNRVTFVVQLQNATNTTVSWTVNNVAGGNSTVGRICFAGSNPCQPITSSTASSVDYIAPLGVPSPNPVTLTATSQQDVTKSASSAITILPHVVVSVSPPSANMAPSATQVFTATVAGTANQQVIWNVTGSACTGTGAPCGIIDAAGRYVAPAVTPTPNVVTIVATSSEDTSRTGAAAVTIVSGPVIVSLLPSSATMGAAELTLRVRGSNFAAASPGPGSQIFIGGVARSTLCSLASECTTLLTSLDVAAVANLSVAVQNPAGERSNTVAFVVAAASAAPGTILLTPGAPAAVNKDIVVVDLSTNGSSSAPEEANLNVVAVGIFDPATGVCFLGGGSIRITTPASGTATAEICAFSLSGLDPLYLYSLSGPSPSDMPVVAKDALGFGIVHLTFLVPATAARGARTLFIRNANLDVTAATGAIDVQ